MNYLYAFFIVTMLGMQALPARAQTTPAPDVFISEINWAGSSASQADEWIEIYNADSQSVDLGGWILTGSASSSEALAIVEGTVLDAGDTLLIANYNSDSDKTTLTVEPDLVTAALSLSNSSQEIFLAKSDGTVVDSVGDGGVPEAGSTSPITSMERDPQTRAWFNATGSANLSDPDQFGTPGVVANTTDTSSQSDESSSLTAEQLEHCYQLFMPSLSNEDSQENTDSGEEPTIVEEVDEVPAETNETHTEREPTSEEKTAVTVEPGSVLINEVVSDPQDGPEWVELFNTTESDIDLSGWTITEGSGKTTVIENQQLSAGGFAVIETIAGNLNNGGDSIVLTDPNDNLIDTMLYGVPELAAPSKGESLARDTDHLWHVTQMITPGEQNVIDALTQTAYEDSTDVSDTELDSVDEHETVSDDNEERAGETDVVSDEPDVHHIVAIADIAEEEHVSDPEPTSDNNETVVEGVITALPETFGAQIAFVDGMQLYFHHADWPELNLGDVIRVTGEASIAWDEERVKISEKTDIELLSSGTIEAIDLPIAQALQQDIGSLVHISGDIGDIDGKSLTLQDDSGEMVVTANERTGMSWSDLKTSAYSMTGIIRTRNGEVTLAVRDWNDVQETPIIDESAESTEEFLNVVSTESSDEFPVMGTVVVTTTAGTFLYWFLRFKLLPTLG